LSTHVKFIRRQATEVAHRFAQVATSLANFDNFIDISSDVILNEMRYVVYMFICLSRLYNFIDCNALWDDVYMFGHLLVVMTDESKLYDELKWMVLNPKLINRFH
jgi:hypothetical protein